MFKRKNKEIKDEDYEELVDELSKKGFNDLQIKAIEQSIINKGFYKKYGLTGLKRYKGNVILYIHTDGQVEVIEDKHDGLLEMKLNNTTRRHGLEPRKLLDLPTPYKDQTLKGWILYEEEAFAYPNEPVFDSGTLDNIVREFEARLDLENQMYGNDWRKLFSGRNILLGIVLIVVGYFIYTSVLPQVFPQMFPKTILEPIANITNVTNMTNLVGA